jgi:DNA-dependent RNA polymerase auxiliary subunit epsilon
MKLDVIDCFETPNGLIVNLDVDEEGRQYLLERGFNAVLVNAIKNLEGQEVEQKVSL